MICRLVIMSACLAIGAWSPAIAWGPLGHDLVAELAYLELSPAARRQAEALLAGARLPEFRRAGNWADEWRSRHRETAPWHFVDIPRAAAGLEEDRDCPAGDCIVAAIARLEAELASPVTPALERGRALAFLIHFIGDIHQPLHAADDADRGGNDVPAVFFGAATNVFFGRAYPLNLHVVFDVSLPERLFPQGAALAARTLEAAIGAEQRRQWCATPVATWAEESHAIARDLVYAALPPGRPVALGQAYVDATAPAIAAQLSRAGVRLACLLEKDLAR